MAIALVVLVAFVYLMWKGRGNTFFYDDWSWIELRRSGLHAILASYNQHLVAAPVAVYQLLLHTVGLTDYWLYRLLGTVAHLACATLVFVFVRRRIGAAAALVVVPVVFLGSGWDYLLEPVSLGFVASLTLSIGALLALERGDRRGDALACTLLVGAVACSEFTVVFLVGIAAALPWESWGSWESGESWESRSRKPSLRRVWVCTVPLALYAAWWLAYHEPSMARENLTAAPAFAADLAASAVGGLLGLGLDWGRPILLATLGLVGWRLTHLGAWRPRTAMLLVAAGTFWLLVGLGRANLGEPSASRYVYTGAILVLLILAEAFRGVQLSPKALGVAAAVVLFALAGNLRALGRGEASLRTASRVVKAELGALQLARRTAAPGLVLDPHYAPQVIAGQYFAAIDAIGSSPADSPAQLLRGPQDARAAADKVLVRAGALRTGPGSRRLPASRAAGSTLPPVDRAGGGTMRIAGGCLAFTPTARPGGFDLTLPPGGIDLASSGGEVTLSARRFGFTFDSGAVATVPANGVLAVRAGPDASPLAWHLRLATSVPVRACGA